MHRVLKNPEVFGNLYYGKGGRGFYGTGKEQVRIKRSEKADTESHSGDAYPSGRTDRVKVSHGPLQYGAFLCDNPKRDGRA